MSQNADHPADPAQQHREVGFAIRSACWGSIPQVMVKDSSVIVIFAALIGASETVSVLCTSLQDLANCLLVLPFAWLSTRLGCVRQIVLASLCSVLALLAAAAAPWCGPAAGPVMMLALILFAVTLSAYVAAWFPLVDAVVPPGERGLFFGRMRFAWQLCATLFILASGWFVGKYATVPRLQIIIVLAALVSLGRAWYIARIRSAPMPDPRGLDLRTGVREALGNRPLTGFAIYLFFLYAAANATVPVVFVFARYHLKLPDNVIVILSAVGMGGLIAGFPLGGMFVHRCGVKGVFLGAHLGFALLNLTLLAVRDDSAGAIVLLGAVIAAYGFLFACASIAVSSELLALSPPGNKAVSLAFGSSLYSAGLGGSRALASVLLGSGILAETWSLGGTQLTRYHSLFLFFACGIFTAMLLLAILPAMTRTAGHAPAAPG
ncbi:MAG TPA: MFS transporter [Planctomycetota bacterium]|nr:MFS transporter [Planctomycetota bacterium]